MCRGGWVLMGGVYRVGTVRQGVYGGVCTARVCKAWCVGWSLYGTGL